MNCMLIRGGVLVTYFFESYETVRITEADILVEDGVITKIGHSLDYDATVIDATGKVVMPGFINSHSRSLPAVLCRGIIEGHNLSGSSVALDKRITQLTEMALSVLSEEEIGSCLQLAIMEMINGGVTTVLEQCPNAILRQFIDLAMEKGLRANVAATPFQTHTIGTGKNGGGYLDMDIIMGMWGKWRDLSTGQIEIWLAHCLSNMNDARMLKGIRDVAEKTGIRVTIDLSQTEGREFRQRFGMSPEYLLADEGLLSPKVVLTGCFGQDRSQLEGSGVHVVHCARRGVENGAVSPYFPRYSATPNVAVGTDYYSNDFLTELKTMVVLGKLWQTGFDSIKATDVFYGATVGGAKAMGRHDIGRLLVGYRGDLLIVNDKNPFLRPMMFPVINLLHYGNSSDIDTVIVDGKVLKQGGDLVGMKKEDISDKAEKAVLKCWAHARKLGVI